MGREDNKGIERREKGVDNSSSLTTNQYSAVDFLSNMQLMLLLIDV